MGKLSLGWQEAVGAADFPHREILLHLLSGFAREPLVLLPPALCSLIVTVWEWPQYNRMDFLCLCDQASSAVCILPFPHRQYSIGSSLHLGELCDLGQVTNLSVSSFSHL